MKRRSYEVWSEYNDFIKSLHLESEKEKKKSSFWKNYLKKVLVVFFASFFTTFSFKFLMDPNGLYNSGINGVIQILSKYKSNSSSTNKVFSFYYYSTVIIVNAFIILATEVFFPGNFEMNSTAFFYVISQYIWSTIFNYFNLKMFIFNRLNGPSESSHALTLPFYILVGIVGSALHTFGYSFIYQAKSSPGGFDIITSTVSQKNEEKVSRKKNKISINLVSKLFGFFVIFAITLISFIFMEDKNELIANQLIRTINNNESEAEEFKNIIIENNNQKKKIENKQNLIQILEKIDRGKITEDQIHRVIIGFKNLLNLENYDDELKVVITYLKNGKKGLLKYYQKKLQKLYENWGKEIEIRRSSQFPEKDQFDQYIRERKDINRKIDLVKNSIYEKNLAGYLQYTTNNEQLWGSIVYVLLSSYFINIFFPKNKILKVYFTVYDEKELRGLVEQLNNYRIYYFKSTSIKDKLEKSSITVCCLITKWNYQLISDKIGQFEKVAICETDEKSQ